MLQYRTGPAHGAFGICSDIHRIIAFPGLVNHPVSQLSQIRRCQRRHGQCDEPRMVTVQVTCRYVYPVSHPLDNFLHMNACGFGHATAVVDDVRRCLQRHPRLTGYVTQRNPPFTEIRLVHTPSLFSNRRNGTKIYLSSYRSSCAYVKPAGPSALRHRPPPAVYGHKLRHHPWRLWPHCGLFRSCRHPSDGTYAQAGRSPMPDLALPLQAAIGD